MVSPEGIRSAAMIGCSTNVQSKITGIWIGWMSSSDLHGCSANSVLGTCPHQKVIFVQAFASLC